MSFGCPEIGDSLESGAEFVGTSKGSLFSNQTIAATGAVTADAGDGLLSNFNAQVSAVDTAPAITPDLGQPSPTLANNSFGLG